MPVYVEMDFGKRELRVIDVAKKITDTQVWEKEMRLVKVAELHGSTGFRDTGGIAQIKKTPGWTYQRNIFRDPVTGAGLGGGGIDGLETFLLA